jgi:hypothetical protein
VEQKQIDELKSIHGKDLVSVEYEGVECVFRKPKRQEYDRWLASSRDDSTVAGRELVQSCVVYPSAVEALAHIDLYPALLAAPGGYVDSITELAGLGKTGVLSTKKKL